MGYVEKSLVTGEEVIYKAKIHWMIYLPGLAYIAAGVAAMAYHKELAGYGAMLGVILLLAGMYDLVKAIVYKITTELAVTNKRVIAKFGFIKRNTMELNHNKIESLTVNQGVIQRLLNAGTVNVQGTGSGKTPIPNIDEPLVFRRHALEVAQ
jgi:uncharacterized membrane protein YdbT with pleckstrin-like domain